MEESSPRRNDSKVLSLIGVGLFVGIAVALGIVAMALLGGAPVDSSIDTAWTLERLNDSHTMIVHDGGEPVSKEHLVVTVDSYERQFASPSVLAEGDAMIFESRADQVVRLYWDKSRDKGQLLETWRPERT